MYKPNWKARYLQFTLAHGVHNPLFSLKYYKPLLLSELDCFRYNSKEVRY